MTETIDLETAKEYVEAQGYTCVQLDPLLENNANSKLFNFNVDALGSSVTYFLGTVWMFGVFRINQLTRTLYPQVIDSTTKKKNKVK